MSECVEIEIEFYVNLRIYCRGILDQGISDARKKQRKENTLSDRELNTITAGFHKRQLL